MRVVILNGSARGKKGVTAKLLEPLSRGLGEAGAEVKQFDLGNLAIAPCTACLSCMHLNTGVCVVKDDMQEIYESLKTSELLIMATPVYLDNMTAQLKTVIDRCICSMKPFLMKDESGRRRHPCAWPMPKKFLLLAVSGFPEMETFDPLVATFRAQAANFLSEPLGEICIPGSIAIQMEAPLLNHYLALLEEAGRAIAQTGVLQEDLLKELRGAAVSMDQYDAISVRYEAWCTDRLNQCRKSAKGFAQ